MSWVARLRSRTATIEPSAMIAIGLGASYSKRTLPGFWIKKSPLVLLPSGPTWTKFPASVCSDERYELTRAACAFWLASKDAKRLAGTFRRGSGITGLGTCVVPVVIGPLCESDASRALGAGLGTGTVCAGDGVTITPMDVAISNTSAPRGMRMGDCSAIRCFCPVNESSCPAVRPFYRALHKRRYRFYVKKWHQFVQFLAVTGSRLPLKSGFLPLRPKFRVFRRDWPGRRCLRVPSAPSAMRRDYIRSGAGAECSWSRPCGRV